MDFFKVASFEKAKSIIKENLDINTGIEILSLANAISRRTAEDIISTESVPDYDRSTVDGYAVRASNTYGATDSVPAMLKMLGKTEMGVVGKFSVHSGETVYVPTGGAVPEGADAMVMLEYTELFGDSVAIYKPVSVAENVIKIGDDIEAGDVIIRAGGVITPLKSGVLAALGFETVKTYKPIRVAIISTGDEIVGIGEKTRIGQIRDTNTVINSALCSENGFDVVSKVMIKDGYSLLDNAVKEAVKSADIVLISGGSSIGAMDYTEQVLSDEGEILVHGIALKPGKPTIAAKVKGKLVFGLPGHPMACLLTLKLLVIGAINELYGDGEAKYLIANTTINFPSSPGRLTVQPVVLDFTEEGVFATPMFYKSGQVSILAEAAGYVLIGQNEEGVYRGQKVKVYLL